MSVQVTNSAGVTTVLIDRPERRNAVDPATALLLYDSFIAFERDPEARVAVLAGAGGAFCAGFDLKALAAGVDEWLQQLHFGEDHRDPPLGPMGPTRLQLSKPVIAAVSGPAVAGGMELALWCDLRIMEASAYMGVYSRRWGVPLMDGGTVRLPRLVGMGRAMELVLTGRRVDATECSEIGLCERVVGDGEALATARSLAARIAAFPGHCLRADRRSLIAQQGLPLPQTLRQEYANCVPVVHSEAVPGAARFADGAGRHGHFEETNE